MNTSLHISQVQGFSFVCTFMWDTWTCFWENAILQILQAIGFSFACALMWRARFNFEKKCSMHILQVLSFSCDLSELIFGGINDYKSHSCMHFQGIPTRTVLATYFTNTTLLFCIHFSTCFLFIAYPIYHLTTTILRHKWYWCWQLIFIYTQQNIWVIFKCILTETSNFIRQLTFISSCFQIDSILFIYISTSLTSSILSSLTTMPSVAKSCTFTSKPESSMMAVKGRECKDKSKHWCQ